MSSRTLISFLTWNKLDFLKNTLSTFHEYNGNNHEIIVVDNGSTDGTVPWLRENGYRVLENGENLGIYRGSVTGWDLAFKEGYDFVFNMQNDFPSIHKTPFELMERYLDENQDVGYIRASNKKDRSTHYITGEVVVKEAPQDIGGYMFVKYNYPFNFHPCLFRTAHVPHFVEVTEGRERETKLMKIYEDKVGLKACRITSPACYKTLVKSGDLRKTKAWKR